MSGTGPQPLSVRRVAIVALPDSQILDIAGPLAVFTEASRIFQSTRGSTDPAYLVELVSTAPDRMAACYCGVSLTAAADFRTHKGRIDTLLIAGGYGVTGAPAIEGFVPWVRQTARTARRAGAVCSGAVVLAEAGVLDGRRATTHWRYARQIADAYPAVHFDPDPIFVRDGKFYTSAGVTAGIDLSLAMVEEDLGAEVALLTARGLVVFLRRPGSQSQFSAALALQASDRGPLNELQSWIYDHLEEALTVERLAEQARMSPRNFARVFKEELGVTPGRFLLQIRIEAARRRLEESGQRIEQIAAECGFGSAESMRQAFQRVLRVSPQDYRKRFSTGEKRETYAESKAS